MGGSVRRTQYQALNESAVIVRDADTIASERIYSTDFLAFNEAPVDSWRYRYVKRGIDIVCSLMMIAVFAIPGLLIAAAIVATSSGPVFYRERRIGQNGRLFRIWKFRSMHRNAAQRAHIADSQPGTKVLEWRMHKHLRDPRITQVGGFLRKWSLDELPQLFNVLAGDMSLIGPRPIVETETVLYGKLISVYLTSTPGLSGLWQVSGRSHIDYDKRAKLDAKYVQSWSLGSDLMILFRTVPAVLGRIGAK
jgi:lipopolysaccharide/colanic/teichoic acid biosynthesis glycosyltransferase